ASAPAAADRVLLLHQQQCAVGDLGLARAGVGLDRPAVLPVRHESAWLEEEHPGGAYPMSIVQDFDLTHLDRLLRTFTERPQALNLDTQLLALMQALQADHLDLLPLPGQGHTLQRWQTLARI